MTNQHRPAEDGGSDLSIILSAVVRDVEILKMG
jgi:hypothetical protein